MKAAYIAGPFRAETPWLVEQNVRRAERVALAAHLEGYAAICPHTMCRHLEGAASDESWLEAGLELLRRCDVLILLPGWEVSSGTRAEFQAALDAGQDILHAELHDGEDVSLYISTARPYFERCQT
jgi:hypothetical protein